MRDVGITFEALSERREELTEAIRGQKNTFEGLAARDEALAETFQILPTFQRETRATMTRLDEFRVDANPLILDLIPVARELSPTLDSVRRLAPNLRLLFKRLGPLQRASMRGLPALRDFLDGLAPVIDELNPFLADLNPIVRYLESQKATVADFLMGPAVSLSGAADPGSLDPPAPLHMLRQLSIIGTTETLSIHPNRVSTNRGHGYLADGVLNSYDAARFGIWPNFDCKNTDYAPLVGGDPDEDEIVRDQSVPGINMGNPPNVRFAPCWVQPDFASPFGETRAPRIFTDP